MKKFSKTLFFTGLLFNACCAYAVQTQTLTSYFPAPVGAYNKLQVVGSVTCTANNVGTLFFDPTTGRMNICAIVNAQPAPVAYPHECFNSFCSYQVGEDTCTLFQCTDIPGYQTQNVDGDGKHGYPIRYDPDNDYNTYYMRSEACCPKVN